MSGLGRGEFLLKIHNFLDLRQKPPIDPCKLEDFLDRESRAQGVANEEYPLRVGHAQLAADHVARKCVAVAVHFRPDAPGLAVAAQAAAADLERTQAFLQA